MSILHDCQRFVKCGVLLFNTTHEESNIFGGVLRFLIFFNALNLSLDSIVILNCLLLCSAAKNMIVFVTFLVYHVEIFIFDHRCCNLLITTIFPFQLIGCFV